MSLPVYKVEIWEPGAGSALYSLTTDVISIYSKEVLTDGVGNFTVQLPTRKGASYLYNDIDAFDIVKLWYGQGTVATDPTFVGRVGKISALLTVEGGFTRIVSGLSQGEVLLRRQKTNKLWTAQDASVIATDVATDLGILHAADIDADTNDETIEVRTRSYFDILREVSDYWYDATHKVQKDFWVHTDGHLHWKARPVRTGVVTFAVGTNIKDYTVTQQVDQVKNNITVKGFAEKKTPLNDEWCEIIAPYWTATPGKGALSLDGVNHPVGISSIHCQPDNFEAEFKCTFPSRMCIRDINELHFYHIVGGNATDGEVRIHAPDAANYFYDDTITLGAGTYFNDLALGPNNVYDVEKNPNGKWKTAGAGSPNWWDLSALEFWFDHDVANPAFGPRVDGIYFYPDRWTGTASDLVGATSSGVLYGQRDLEVTDDKLHLDLDCAKRAETLLLMSKGLPKQVGVTVNGNTNILIGDRAPLTIPAEGIATVDFDIVTVEHSLTNKGFTTTATMVNSLNTRQLLEASPLGMIGGLNRRLRDLTVDTKRL